MMFSLKSSRNGVGIKAMLQAFTFAASLVGILSHGSLGLVENLSRQENSLVTYTDYLGAFTISRHSKPIDGQPPGNILAAELFNRKAGKPVHINTRHAQRPHRCGIFCISLIRSPPVISPI
jgi:hypothetical protein